MLNSTRTVLELFSSESCQKKLKVVILLVCFGSCYPVLLYSMFIV